MASSDSRFFLSGVEPYIDTNVYCGPYPFRPLPAPDPEGLLALLDEAVIETAFVTPFPSIFHTRPWSGLSPWIGAMRENKRIRFWATLNPALPGWEDDLAAAAACGKVVGIRLFPRCHGYTLFAPSLIELLGRAADASLPVCLTARLLDDRLYPRMLRIDPPLDLEMAGALLKRFPEVRWVFTGFSMPEIGTLRTALLAHPDALVDIGLSKPFEPWWENVAALLPADRLLLGTGAPLYYHGGTRLSLHRSEIDPEPRRLLLGGNARRLLKSRSSSAANGAPHGAL